MDFSQALGILQARSTSKASTNGEECVDCAGEVGEFEPSPPVQPAAELEALGLDALLRLLLARQEERVGVYRRFEEGFETFLQVAEAEIN